MGDPANIRFWENTQDEHPISLYLHWGADEAAKELAEALERARHRWDDADYATRIAVQSILEAQDITPEHLGAGLYVGTADAGGPVYNVNWGSKVVWTADQRIPFEQFIRGEWKVV